MSSPVTETTKQNIRRARLHFLQQGRHTLSVCLEHCKKKAEYFQLLRPKLSEGEIQIATLVGGKRRLLGLGERRKECVRGKLVAALVAGGNEDAMASWLSEKTENETALER